MGDNGRFIVESELEVPPSEWHKWDIFTCQVTDPSSKAPIKKDINKCSVLQNSTLTAEVYLIGPSIRDRSQSTELNATCLVIGHNLKDFHISWTVDGLNRTTQMKTNDPTRHANQTETRISTLSLTKDEWNGHKNVSCAVVHICSSEPQMVEIIKAKDPKRPTIQILETHYSDLSKSNESTLACLISGFYPADISVQWKMNGSEIRSQEYTIQSGAVTQEKDVKTYTMDSKLRVPKSKWQYGAYACTVHHESSEEPIEQTITDVFGSVIPSPPKAHILRATNQLVCLVSDFSPKAINITWLSDKSPAPHAYTMTGLARGSNGKFSTQSTLHISDTDWTPGMVFTCKVVHEAANIPLLVNISKPVIINEKDYFDEDVNGFSPEDDLGQIWSTACTFIFLFLISFVYSSIATIVKVE
ncbi:IGHE protein, partial [Amia calva]|nr:IGHE protein [Amia calva]